VSDADAFLVVVQLSQRLHEQDYKLEGAMKPQKVPGSSAVVLRFELDGLLGKLVFDHRLDVVIEPADVTLGSVLS
jgi:hypothetical protein